MLYRMGTENNRTTANRGKPEKEDSYNNPLNCSCPSFSRFHRQKEKKNPKIPESLNSQEREWATEGTTPLHCDHTEIV